MLKENRGFSLVELAVVIILISLLTSGVVGGIKLKQSMKISALVKEISNIKSSVQLFRVSYSYLPVDFPKAQKFWGTSGITNGDGDGRIEWGTETVAAPVHLVKSEIVPSNVTVSSEVLLPVPSFDAVARLIHRIHTTGAIHGGYNYSKNRNLLQIGSGSSNVDAPFLTPYQAKQVDKRIDDGHSKTGKMSYRIAAWSGTTDTTCSGGGADYDVSSKSVGCNIVLELD